ncbi:MAG: hypothetical protein WD226_07605 [Planctomycetota bacterium]
MIALHRPNLTPQFQSTFESDFSVLAFFAVLLGLASTLVWIWIGWRAMRAS